MNGPKEEEKAAPQIVSVSFRGVRSEVLLHALEERGIYVSSGSACSSNKKLPVSAVLKEIHLESDLLDSTLRFSFCNETTKEETGLLFGESERTASGAEKIRKTLRIIRGETACINLF